jgi:hypothetical protein
VSRFLPTQEGRPGLLEVLRSTASLEDTLVIDPATGLSILPVAADPADAHELLTGDEMDRLLENARQHFDAIIIDTAPVLPIADAAGAGQGRCVGLRRALAQDAGQCAAFGPAAPARQSRATGRRCLTRVDMRKQARFGYGEDAFYQSYRQYYS